MKKRSRLVRRSDFQRVMGGRRRIHSGALIVALVEPRAQGPTRVGVTVSRRLRRAVDRNRARRRVREVARRRLLGPGSPARPDGAGWDLVLIAREGALKAPYSELEAEAGAVLRQLSTSG